MYYCSNLNIETGKMGADTYIGILPATNGIAKFETFWNNQISQQTYQFNWLALMRIWPQCGYYAEPLLLFCGYQFLAIFCLLCIPVNKVFV